MPEDGTLLVQIDVEVVEEVGVYPGLNIATYVLSGFLLELVGCGDAEGLLQLRNRA